MNDGALGCRRLRRMRWPRTGLLTIVAVIALLIASGCSGSPPGHSPGRAPAAAGSASPSPGPGGSSAPGRPTGQPKQLAYSECMRAHGVPGVPTSLPSPASGKPPSQANFRPAQANGPAPGSPQWDAAQHACRSLMPAPTLVSG
jgi:hypothetical protein